MQDKSTDQSIDTAQKVNDTLNLINQANKVIENSIHQDLVLVLGNSGVGKTPFTKWMTEDNTKLISVRSAPGKPYLMQDDNNKIGNSTTKSATVFPDLFVNQTINQPYYDFPGFKDTRGMSYGIATMYSMQGIISKAKSVKMVFLVDYDSVKPAGSRDGFTGLIKSATNFIKDIGKFNSSIALVVSKVPKHINDEQLSNDQVIQIVANFIEQDVKPNLEKEDKAYYTQAIKFIDTILSKDGNDYHKIGLFRFPDKNGSFSDIPIVQEGKPRIEKIIYEKLRFTEIAKDDFVCTIDDSYQNDISNVVQKIKDILISNVEKMGEKIKQHFLHIEETVADIGQLYDKTQAGYDQLLKTQKNAVNLTSSKKCIELVTKSSAAINNSTIDNTLLDTTTPYTDFLAFLDSNKISPQAINSFKCTTGLDKVVEYLRDARVWYMFLNNLYERLSEYNIQKDTSTCKNLASNIIQKENNKEVSEIGLEPFLEQCYSEYKEYREIKDITLGKSKLNALNKVLDFTLRYELEQLCNDSKLLLKGHYVKLSDINRTCTAKFIEIFALNKVFIDTDLDKTGNKTQIAIIAPTWDIQGIRKITLDGQDAEAHDPPKANDSDNSNIPGTNGLPGKPGGSGGSFLGIGEKFINANGLTISANGGKGGPGQHGGDGADAPNIPQIDKDSLNVDTQYSLQHMQNMYSPQYYTGKCNGFYCEHYISGWNVPYRFTWDLYSAGSVGGNGGVRGVGGNPGNISIIVLSNNVVPINIEQNQGPIGLTNGNGGIGGKNANSLHIEYNGRSLISWFDNLKYTYNNNNTRASSGMSGIANPNETIKSETVPLQPLQLHYIMTYLIKSLANDSIIKSDLENFFNLLSNNTYIKDLNTVRHSRKQRDIDDVNDKQADNDEHNDNVNVLIAASAGSTLQPLGYNLVSWLKNSISQLKNLGSIAQIKSWFQPNVKSTEQSKLDIVDNIYQDAISVGSSDNMGIEDDLHYECLSERVYNTLISDNSPLHPIHGNYNFNINGSLILANLIVRMSTGVKYDSHHIFHEDEDNDKRENIDMEYAHRMMFSAHVPVEDNTDNIELLG